MREPRTDHRRGIWRYLRLDHGDRPFLIRRGIDVRLFGVYVHEITAPDPGLDRHNHPWVFASLVLRGGYTEEYANALSPQVTRERTWRRWSYHRMRLTDTHRITRTEPGTVTLVFRGRKVRPWAFYTPTGWVDYRVYDYEARRPVSEVRT